ncbi:uncharacterized protein LOC121415463 [Lytechinus variegatus]|uniref:uncharacterized protein LOC121415463 n=1 Tax=Lytechinus variegatus TaxID=7654 RepID=UPI001BB18ADF|nr:uncharacterized protein LOC121415463 [Lytechinus variegatus]
MTLNPKTDGIVSKSILLLRNIESFRIYYNISFKMKNFCVLFAFFVVMAFVGRISADRFTNALWDKRGVFKSNLYKRGRTLSGKRSRSQNTDTLERDQLMQMEPQCVLDNLFLLMSQEEQARVIKSFAKLNYVLGRTNMKGLVSFNGNGVAY